MRASVGARERARRSAGRRRGRPLIWWTRNFTGRGPRPAVGGRHHLRSDMGGVFVSGRGARCVQPAHRGVVDGHTPAGPSWCSTRSTWRCISAVPGPSSTTPTRARSTPRSPLGSAAGRRACVPPMGSVGDCYDQPRCVRAFSPRWSASSSLATVSAPGAEARMEVFGFIEGFYNPHRRHSSIDNLSPVNYERRQQRTP